MLVAPLYGIHVAEGLPLCLQIVESRFRKIMNEVIMEEGEQEREEEKEEEEQEEQEEKEEKEEEKEEEKTARKTRRRRNGEWKGNTRQEDLEAQAMKREQEVAQGWLMRRPRNFLNQTS